MRAHAHSQYKHAHRNRGAVDVAIDNLAMCWPFPSPSRLSSCPGTSPQGVVCLDVLLVDKWLSVRVYIYTRHECAVALCVLYLPLPL